MIKFLRINYKKYMLHIIGIGVLLFSIIPVEAATISGIYPSEPFNGLQINYHVSGVSVTSFEDVDGFATFRTLIGEIVGDEIVVSGTAHFSAGVLAILKVSTRGSDIEEYRVEFEPGQSRSFELTIPLEEKTAHATFSIELYGRYYSENRSLMVRGNFTREVEEDKNVVLPQDDESSMDQNNADTDDTDSSDSWLDYSDTWWDEDCSCLSPFNHASPLNTLLISMISILSVAIGAGIGLSTLPISKTGNVNEQENIDDFKKDLDDGHKVDHPNYFGGPDDNPFTIYDGKNPCR